jgi:hypothetical protein
VDEQLVPFATLRACKGADEPSAFPVKREFFIGKPYMINSLLDTNMNKTANLELFIKNNIF